MPNQELEQFIEKSPSNTSGQGRQAGKTDPRYAEGSGEASEQIRQELLKAGWLSAEVENYFNTNSVYSSNLKNKTRWPKGLIASGIIILVLILSGVLWFGSGSEVAIGFYLPSRYVSVGVSVEFGKINEPLWCFGRQTTLEFVYPHGDIISRPGNCFGIGLSWWAPYGEEQY